MSIELDWIYQLVVNYMLELSLEILFWLILLIYIGARFTQPKKGYRQQQYKNANYPTKIWGRCFKINSETKVVKVRDINFIFLSFAKFKFVMQIMLNSSN